MAKTLEHIPESAEPASEEQDQRIIEIAREFFVDSIPTKKPELLKNFSLSELLDIYADMMDREPTIEGFAEFLAGQASKNGNKNEQTENLKKLTAEEIGADTSTDGEFKRFLLEKLPRDLTILQDRARQLSEKFGYKIEQDDLIDELSTEELLDIHKKRQNYPRLPCVR